MAKFHITTKNGRQRALWLRLFGTDTLPVTAAYPHEVFSTDGRSRLVYDLDTRAIGEHGCRRLAACIAARQWGKTFEAALVEVRHGWRIDATHCQLVQPETAVGLHANELGAPGKQTPPARPHTPRPRQPRRPRMYGRGGEPDQPSFAFQ